LDNYEEKNLPNTQELRLLSRGGTLRVLGQGPKQGRGTMILYHRFKNSEEYSTLIKTSAIKSNVVDRRAK
jgi:hypothetical protein